MPTITLNLEDTILQVLKLKSSETKQSISELVNDALKANLQGDLQDIKSWEERKGEETYSYICLTECRKSQNLLNDKDGMANEVFV